MHKKTLALEWRITKVSKNKKTPAKVYSCGFCKTFKNTFSTEHLHGLGVCLAANEFFSNSKNYLCSSVSPFSSFSIFCVTCFFYKLSFWTPQHEERSIQSNYQEVPTKWWFCWFREEMYLGMNAGLWSSVCMCVCVCVCVCDLEFLRTFLRIFVMFVNEEVFGIVLSQVVWVLSI